MYSKLTERVIDLARRTHLTDHDWLSLLEERGEMLKKHLHEITLKPLGELCVIKSFHSLNHDSPKVIGEENRFSLETRGIFPKDNGYGSVASVEFLRRVPPPGIVESPRHSLHRLWGFTRNGQWIGIEVFVEDSIQIQERIDGPGKEERAIEKATSITLTELPLNELCSFAKRTPAQMWDRLGQRVEEWVRDREILLNDAQRLHHFFEHEDAILKTLPKKHQSRD